MSFASDLKVLYHLTLSPIRGKTHAERLESFYGAQAGAYDDFRKRLLKGRQELFESSDRVQAMVIVPNVAHDDRCFRRLPSFRSLQDMVTPRTWRRLALIPQIQPQNILRAHRIA